MWNQSTPSSFYMSSLSRHNLRLLARGLPFYSGATTSLPLPTCLGGNASGRERSGTEVDGLYAKSSPKDKDNLFDFLEMIGASKSLAKEPIFKTKQSKVAIATAKESRFEESNTQGASKPRALADKKVLFVLCSCFASRLS